MSAPATYHSGTPRNQHPAGARWHAHLHGLATAIHAISELDESEQDGDAKVWGEGQVLDVSSCFFVTYALEDLGKPLPQQQ
jgi:hypothetical protein